MPKNYAPAPVRRGRSALYPNYYIAHFDFLVLFENPMARYITMITDRLNNRSGKKFGFETPKKR